MRRRAFIAAATAAVAVPQAALAARKPKDEVGILRAALELEQLGVYVYDAGIKSALLDESQIATVQGLRDHEQQHADAVAASLEALGGARPRPPQSPAEADALLERLGATGRLARISTRDAFFALAHEIEMLQVQGYAAAAGDLDDVRLIQTTASILAAEGAHLVVIRSQLGRERVPEPFELAR